jgi:hypothetical protein
MKLLFDRKQWLLRRSFAKNHSKSDAETGLGPLSPKLAAQRHVALRFRP